MSKYYITTPIYYINDKPHIGHAYTTIAADVLARYHRGLGQEVFFLTGTDENSQKTVTAATAADKPLKQYTDEMASHWQQMWDTLGISYDRFIRTTEPEHAKSVLELVDRVKASGDIYKGKYKGLYCEGCEAFYRPDDLVGGKCPIHHTQPQQLEEENYFFKLSKYQEPLLKHIKENPSFIAPESRRNEVIAFIERGLEDFSVSRAGKNWGIPWPGDKDQVVYVWFDALANYLSGIGFGKKSFDEWWPANLHLVGKDIIKFHCIYWPAMLLSAKIELPVSVFAHGFFTLDGQKISKSLGNAIDPTQLAGPYGIDALRYYLLSEIPFGGDGEFNHERFAIVYETELANELGNLVQRVATMIMKYQGGSVGQVGEFAHDVEMYHDAMTHNRFDKALAVVWDLIRGLNQYIDEEKPWKLAGEDMEQLQKVLSHAVVDLEQIGTLLMPFMPTSAEKIIKTFQGGEVNTDIGIIFPKPETK